MKKDSFYLTGEKVAKKPYHYRACGLDGIYLLNGYTVEQHDGEEHVAVLEMDDLHRAIGRYLVTNRKALSPKEARFLRNTMGLTQAELADKIGNTSQSVARWEKGECEIPGAAEKLLRAIFLASVTPENELESLRQLITSSESDTLDEFRPRPAQFELFGSWLEKAA